MQHTPSAKPRTVWRWFKEDLPNLQAAALQAGYLGREDLSISVLTNVLSGAELMVPAPTPAPAKHQQLTHDCGAAAAIAKEIRDLVDVVDSKCNRMKFGDGTEKLARQATPTAHNCQLPPPHTATSTVTICVLFVGTLAWTKHAGTGG